MFLYCIIMMVVLLAYMGVTSTFPLSLQIGVLVSLTIPKSLLYDTSELKFILPVHLELDNKFVVPLIGATINHGHSNKLFSCKKCMLHHCNGGCTPTPSKK